MIIKNNYIIKLLRKLKYYWYPKEGSVNHILENLNCARNVNFIEIGANLTDRNDPIAQYLDFEKWNGILIEPQKDVFFKLREKYGDNPRIKLINAAISENDGSRRLYRFNFSEDSWVTSLSSFSKNQLIKHYEHGWLRARAIEMGYELPENLEEIISSEEVDCLSFKSLIERYQIKNVDLLVIDTEGYDYEILKMIEFKKFKPNVLMFEHRHLSQREFKAALKLLRGENYKLFLDGGDTIAYLSKGF